MTSNYLTDHTINSLIGECEHMIRAGDLTHISHVFKEGNKCADFIANMGQKENCGTTGTTVLEQPVKGMMMLLQADTDGFMMQRVR